MPGDGLRKVIASALPPASGDSQTTDFSQLLQNLLPSSGQGLPEAMTGVSQGLSGLTTATQAESAAASANTQALSQNTSTQSGGSSIGSTIGSVASDIFGSSLSPILSGLIHLFTGGSSEAAPPPLTKFELPPSITLNAANTPGGGVSGADYGQYGLPRANDSGSQTAQSGASGSGGTAALPPITIHIDAMDSQSFLDHSNDIADAVRQAMLNMHSLNDVVSDL